MSWSSKRWGPDGFTEEHSVRGLQDVHEGSVEDCSASECQWPQAGIRVLWPVDGRMLLCEMMERDEKVAEVKLPDGGKSVGPRRWATEVEWGEYCPHGVKIIEAVPAEHICKEPKPSCDRTGELGHLCIDHWPVCLGCYPDGRKILPWACNKGECSEASYDAGQRAAEEEYYATQREEFR